MIKLTTPIKNRLILGMSFALVASFLIWQIPFDRLAKTDNSLISQTLNDQQATEPTVDFFSTINLKARSAIVWDIEKNEPLYSLNTDERMPLASLTKVMTALTAMETMSKDEIIPITERAVEVVSNAGLQAGQSWRLRDLLVFSLVTSSNGSSRAVALTASAKNKRDFITDMNQLAKTIGLQDTYFINETGLDVGDSYGGSYGTAKDMALLFSYVVRQNPELFLPTNQPVINLKSIENYSYTGYNTNQAVGDIPGIMISKTGYTVNAGGNLGIVFDAGLRQPMAVIVLGSTREGRFEDVKNLVQATLRYTANK